MVGGSLSRPAERYPDTFGGSEFLKKYPYFLACAVPATFSALAWVITFTFLKEVGPKSTRCVGPNRTKSVGSSHLL